VSVVARVELLLPPAVAVGVLCRDLREPIGDERVGEVLASSGAAPARAREVEVEAAQILAIVLEVGVKKKIGLPVAVKSNISDE
jgi:hypothetical protein